MQPYICELQPLAFLTPPLWTTFEISRLTLGELGRVGRMMSVQIGPDSVKPLGDFGENRPHGKFWRILPRLDEFIRICPDSVRFQ